MKFERRLNSDSDWGRGLKPRIEKLVCSTAVAEAAQDHGIALPRSNLCFWAVHRVKTTFYIFIFLIMRFTFDITHTHNLITICHNELVF